jgi:hypothetical protein
MLAGAKLASRYHTSPRFASLSRLQTRIAPKYPARSALFVTSHPLPATSYQLGSRSLFTSSYARFWLLYFL